MVASSVGNAAFQLLINSNPNPKTMDCFSHRDAILLVGEGDFSFSLSLATELGGSKITATCYDSRTVLCEKYAQADTNVAGLLSTGACVEYDVDCTRLEETKFQVEKFDKIVFNFPHVGGATEEDIEKNQMLLQSFFQSAKSLLKLPRGQIIVSLRNTLFYNRWNIQDQANANGMKLLRTTPFQSHLYRNYQPQRTHPAMREPPSVDNALMYHFVVDENLSNVVGKKNLSLHPSKKQKRKLDQIQLEEKNNRGNSCSIKTKKEISYTCVVCQLSFRDEKKWNGHINSSKHAKKMKATKKLKKV